jgi:hypothetical protein
VAPIGSGCCTVSRRPGLPHSGQHALNDGFPYLEPGLPDRRSEGLTEPGFERPHKSVADDFEMPRLCPVAGLRALRGPNRPLDPKRRLELLSTGDTQLGTHAAVVLDSAHRQEQAVSNFVAAHASSGQWRR